MEDLTIPNATNQRIISIDALRGFDMFWIVGGGAIFHSLDKIFDCPATKFINTQLNHVPWEGFAFEDLIMPLFLFICGVAMPFSFAKRLLRGQSKMRIYRHVIIRFVVLWVLGMIKQGHLLEFNLGSLALYSNTLQTIAAGYLIAAILILEFKPVLQIVITAALMLVYWALMMLVPIPEHGAGMLTPEANLAIYLDHLILGGFQDGTNYSWILSSMVFGVTVMMGVFAGQWLRTNKKPSVKATGLILGGVASIAIGLLWSLAFPIIKHLWTSSFVLFSGGICLVLLGLFYLVIDVWKLRKWAFGFVVIGSNAIFVYMSTSFINYRFTANRLVGGLSDRVGNWDDFMLACTAFALTWLILWYMRRKKIFIRV